MPKDMSRYAGMYEKGRKQVSLDTPLPWYVGRPHDDRASQFMPFAALKGYDQLIDQADRAVEPRAFMTEEQADALNRRIAQLVRGDAVRIAVYEQDFGQREVQGNVTDLALELGWLEVDYVRVLLQDIDWIEPASPA